MVDTYNIPDVDENEEISLYEPITYDKSQDQQQNNEIPPGEYLFRVIELRTQQFEKNDRHPKHTKQSFRLELSTADGVIGTVWDNIPMYRKFLWKYNALAKSIGSVPEDSDQIFINWRENFVGSEGRVKVENGKPWTDRNGNEHKQINLKYLPPAEDNGEMGF